MKRTIFTAFVCLMAASFAAFGQTTTLVCTADTDVNVEYPSLNNGVATPIYSYGPRDHNWGQRDLLLTFDTGMLPDGHSVTEAFLRIFCVQEAKSVAADILEGFTMRAVGLNAPWTESEANWTNSATGVAWLGGDFGGSANYDGSPVGEAVNTGAEDWSGSWVEIDITSLVSAWNAGRPNYGLALQQWARDAGATYGANRQDWASRESAMKPYIAVWTEASTEPAPDAPDGFTVTALSAFECVLTWNDTPTNETTYIIERRVGALGAWDVTNSVPADSTGYLDTTCNPNTQYHYRISAENATGASGYAGPLNDATWVAPFQPTLLQDTYFQVYDGTPLVDTNGALPEIIIDADVSRSLAVDIRDAVVQFDMSGSPEGTVTKAFLRLKCSYEGDVDDAVPANNEDATVTVHAMLSAWNEDFATWFESDDGVNWSGSAFEPGAGTQFDASIAGTATTPDTGTWAGSIVQIDVTTLANEWVQGIRQNHGLALLSRGTANNGKRIDFDSKEGGTPPELHIYIAASTENAPDPATNLSATVLSSTEVVLGWADAATNELGYVIERRQGAAGAWTTNGGTSIDATSYTDTTASPATEYYYRIKAKNSGGESTYSPLASVTTWASPVSAGCVADSYIQDTWGDTNWGAASELFLDGNSAHDPDVLRDALFRFDLSGTAPGTIDRAYLRIFCVSERTNASLIEADITAHRVLVDWNEMEVTWNNRSAGTPWLGTPTFTFEPGEGEDFAAAGGTYPTTDPYDNLGGKWIQIDITTIANDWINGSENNYGVAVLSHSTAGGGKRWTVSSREGANAPQLLIYGGTGGGLTFDDMAGFDANGDLSWTATPGTTYQLWRCDDLINTNWAMIASTNAAGTTVEMVDPTSGSATARYYQIRQQP